jgi:hypothetical protein
MSAWRTVAERCVSGAWRVIGVVAAAAWVCGLSVAGCASDPPPSPSKKEVQSDSDRFFEKMKHEEQERGRGADAPIR